MSNAMTALDRLRGLLGLSQRAGRLLTGMDNTLGAIRTGKAILVPPMAVAAAAAGADGIMVEVHNNPACALCDGPQSLTPDQFRLLNQKVQKVREAVL